MTILTQEMLDKAPGIDIHVHVQGTISARTAWKLGVINGLIRENYFDEDGIRSFKGDRLHPRSGYEHYRDIFVISRGEDGKVEKVTYDFSVKGKEKIFTVFDRIMGIVQGHRHPPGGIQSEDDYKFVMREYLKSCLRQNISYTELQQNIKIAYALYPEEKFPHLSDAEKREKLYELLAGLKDEFAEAGVVVNFLNCYNKTRAADNPFMHDPTIEAVKWVLESRKRFPGLFVGMVSAGSEKDETGWPNMLAEGYDYGRMHDLLLETHSGEGIGSKHMKDCLTTLRPQRNAHGYQAIEDMEIIELIREQGVILLMSPRINVELGCKIYELNGVPTPKEAGGEKRYITKVGDHPFFPMMREHGLEIALVSDDPEMGGVPYKQMIAELAGLKDPENLGSTPPLTAEEFCRSQLNAINRSAGTAEQKAGYIKQMIDFMNEFGLEIEHPTLETIAAKMYIERLGKTAAIGHAV